jgi:hypothetical protein
VAQGGVDVISVATITAGAAVGRVEFAVIAELIGALQRYIRIVVRIECGPCKVIVFAVDRAPGANPAEVVLELV